MRDPMEVILAEEGRFNEAMIHGGEVLPNGEAGPMLAANLMSFDKTAYVAGMKHGYALALAHTINLIQED